MDTIMDELNKVNDSLFDKDIEKIATILTDIKKEIKDEQEEYYNMKKDLESILDYINKNDGIMTDEQKKDIETFSQYLKEKENMIKTKHNIYDKYSNMKKLVSINHEIMNNKQIKFKIPKNKPIESLNFADIIDFENVDENEKEIFKLVYQNEFNKPFIEIINKLINKKEGEELLNELIKKKKRKKKKKNKNKNK
jgi:hypothetical protein